MAAQDFDSWLDSTNYDEYPVFAVEGMRAARFAAEEKFNSAPSANQQRLKEIPPVEKVRADALSHFSANQEESSFPGVVTFVYNYMRRYFS